MKAEHRHDLKTNELAEWLINFPQWAKKNRTTIIYVSVVIVVVAGLYVWKIYSKDILQARQQTDYTRLLTSIAPIKMQILQAQAQGMDTSFMLLTPANNLKALAETTKNDLMAASAFIKYAQVLRAELHYRLEPPGKDEMSTQLNLAKNAYALALARLEAAGIDDSINPSLIASAKFGLGLCAEELGNSPEAKQIYLEITNQPSLQGTTSAVAAKQRLNTMNDYQQEVVFGKAPEIAPPAIPEPAETGLDVNSQLQTPNNVPVTPLPNQESVLKPDAEPKN